MRYAAGFAEWLAGQTYASLPPSVTDHFIGRSTDEFLDWLRRANYIVQRDETWFSGTKTHYMQALNEAEIIFRGLPDSEIEQYLNRHISKRYGNYTKTPIRPPPEQYLIQFIGGPKNAEQEYFDAKQNPHIRNGGYLTVAIKEPITSDPFQLAGATIHQAEYKLTFIPLDQTPFSDAQIVIGVFQ